MKINKEDIDIRYLSEIDLNDNFKEIIDLLNQNYLINFPNHHDFSNQVISNFKDMEIYIKDGSAFVIGAYLGGKVIGFLWAYRRSLLGEERIHISHIVVDSSLRGYGIGTKMIHFIEQYAIAKEIKVIELITTNSNERTIDFYNKHGFNVTRVQLEKKLGDKYADKQNCC